MTTDLMPFQYGDTTVRTIVIDGEPWFVLSDLCAVLGLSSPHKVYERIAEDARNQIPVVDNLGRRQMRTAVVSEPGMYEVVIRSDKPGAVAFRRWLTGEVLPTIRKTGSYSAQPALTEDELIHRALEVSAARVAALTQKVAELEPKAEVADKILEADGDLEVGDAAKVLSRAGIRTGRQRLFAELERQGWVYRHRADGRWRIRQTAIDTGYMLPLPQSHYHPKTGVLVMDPPQPRIRPKGLQKLLAILGGAEQLSLPGGAS